MNTRRSSSPFKRGVRDVGRAWRWVVEAWVDLPVLDYPLVAISSWYFGLHLRLLASVDRGVLPTWAQTMAGIIGGIVGLGTLVVTLLLTVTKPDALNAVLRNLQPGVLRIVIRCLGGLLVMLAVFGLAPLVGTKTHHAVYDSIAVAAISFSVLRSARLWWLIALVIRLLARGAGIDSGGRGLPTVDARESLWVWPRVSANDYGVKQVDLREKP